MPTQTLGKRIRRARLEKGLSGTALAKLIDKSQPYVSDLERGQRTPSLETLRDLAVTLGQPLSYFFAEDDAPTDVDKGPVPTTAVLGTRHSLAELITDQLLQARLLQNGEQSLEREQLTRVVGQAIDNAYHDLHRVLREQREERRREQSTTAG